MPITKLKPRPITQLISTYDIETDKDGQLLDIGFWHDNDYYLFDTWESFAHFLSDNAARLEIIRNRFT